MVTREAVLSAMARRGSRSLRLKRNGNGVVIGGRDSVIVGLVGGGYFQTELKGLELEIRQMDTALGVIRGLGEDGKPLPITSEQEAWWKSSWAPFLQGWRSFYGEYAFGWKSMNFPITTSRVEQMEEYRSRFINLRTVAERLFAGTTVLKNLATPSPVKVYPSMWDGFVETLKGLVLWVILGVGAVVLILALRK